MSQLNRRQRNLFPN